MRKGDFVGLANFAYMIDDYLFRNAFVITWYWTALTLCGTFSLGLFGALLLNRKFKGRGIMLILLLVPYITPTWVSALLFKWLYNTKFGILNEMIKATGLIDYDIQWLVDPDISIIAVALSFIWRVAPYLMLLFLAGLQIIKKDLYDAAMVDGASLVQRFRHITLPQLIPTIIVSLTILTIWCFKTFDRIYIMTGGGPIHATEILSMYIYVQGFRYYRFEIGAAAASILFMIVLAFTVFYKRILKEEK